MRMNPVNAASAAAMAGLLAMMAACSPPHPHHHADGPMKTVDALDCPADEDDLKLTSGASGPGPCVYTDDDGDKVTLQLVKLDGTDSKAALAPFRAAVQAEIPDIKPAGGGATADASTPSSGKGDKVNIDLPGIHIHADGDDKAEVNAMGVHVNADGNGSHHAVITTGGGPTGDNVTVNATDGGAQIDVQEKGSGVRSMFMLASNKPGPHGYKSASFEARGPSSGPLVVAQVLSKGDHNQDLRDAAKALVKHNVGG